MRSLRARRCRQDDRRHVAGLEYHDVPASSPIGSAPIKSLVFRAPTSWWRCSMTCTRSALSRRNGLPARWRQVAPAPVHKLEGRQRREIRASVRCGTRPSESDAHRDAIGCISPAVSRCRAAKMCSGSSADEVGQFLRRMPDGETGERTLWIKFQQKMLLEHPAIEPDPTQPPLPVKQADGTVHRHIQLVRLKPSANVESVEFDTGYDRAAVASYQTFRCAAARPG